MANKKTSRPSGKQTGKSQMMAVNKSQTPVWMRVIIIAVVISFSAGGIAIVASTLGSKGTTASSTDTITAQYQAQVKSAQDVLATDPEDPQAMANVGHAYYEWAVALYQDGQQQASIPVWDKAVGYYDQVLAITPDDDIVLGNKAFALYYASASGSATDRQLVPAALDAFIQNASDNTSLAQQVSDAQSMLAEVESSSAATETTPTP